MLFDGWLLRFARGYTKRANSINALYASRLDVATKIATCEPVFAQSLKPVFRLTPFACPPDLDQVLAQGDYHTITTRGLCTTTSTKALSQNPHCSVAARTRARLDTPVVWSARRCGGAAPHHQAMLDLIPGTRLLVSLVHADSVVACGLGVLEQDYFGVFDLVTAPQQRNKGHGAALIAGMPLGPPPWRLACLSASAAQQCCGAPSLCQAGLSGCVSLLVSRPPCLEELTWLLSKLLVCTSGVYKPPTWTTTISAFMLTRT